MFTFSIRALIAIGALLLSAALGQGQTAETTAKAAATWRSELYPTNWSPPVAAKFETDKLIQDFSYAGYRMNEAPLPSITGPVFDVTKYGADVTGKADSTKAIQDAIDAAAAQGSGVVFLPAGTYLVAPVGSNSHALKINRGKIVLRGAGRDKTFILNTGTAMRQKCIIRVQGSTMRWRVNAPDGAPAVALAADVLSPTNVIPVAATEPFKVGDWVLLRADATDDFVAEQNMRDLWGGKGSRLGGPVYHRQITAIDSAKRQITVDVPVRYYLKTRDNARMQPALAHVEEVGLEDFSTGNVEHPKAAEKDGWAELDFSVEGKPAHDVHGSAAIAFNHARNCWMTRVSTYHPATNATKAHILSNGAVLTECRGVTVKDCAFQYALYGGGGGNGYMYRLQDSNECLVTDCYSGHSRHSFVIAGMASSGNVYLGGSMQNTQVQATGTGTTAGKGGDHHMSLSQSNLIDGVTVDDDLFEAYYRKFGTTFGTPPHGVTAVHSVFWNVNGKSYHGKLNYIVNSDQGRYGYVIGTRGAANGVRTSSPEPERTAPEDHVEGIGKGDTLQPASLFADQLQRRLSARKSAAPKDSSPPPSAAAP